MGRAKLINRFCTLYTVSYYHIVTRIVQKISFLLVVGMVEIARSKFLFNAHSQEYIFAIIYAEKLAYDLLNYYFKYCKHTINNH